MTLQSEIILLSSDCIPSFFLMGALQLLGRVPEINPAQAVRTVTMGSGEAVDLHNRGEMVSGKRADLICFHVAHDVPAMRSVWRNGHRVA